MEAEKTIALGVLGGAAFLLADIRFEHREVLGETWAAWIPLAYAAQGTVMLALAAALVWLWRSPAAFAYKAAALCLATLLAPPYSLDYDTVVLAPAIAFVAADRMTHGFAPWEKTALAALWFLPAISRSITQLTLVPLGVIVLLAAFAFVLWRAAEDTGVPAGAVVQKFASSPARSHSSEPLNNRH